MNPSEDRLARELKQEADQLSEPFSPALHGRIMHAVRNTQTRRVIVSPWLRRGVGAVAAVAAVAMLAAWIWTKPSTTPTVTINTPRQVSPRGDLSLVRELIQDTSAPLRHELQQALPASALAGLDDDAQSLGRFVARQFDQLPHRIETTR